ncbi:MAG: hypothetical protein AB1714_04070 [Acidobacteriota bacterium]
MSATAIEPAAGLEYDALMIRVRLASLLVAVVPVCAIGNSQSDGGMELTTYQADGRVPIGEIYRATADLAKGGFWNVETVYVDRTLPIQVLSTKQKGPAIWILAGIHGEEPAPANAVYENTGRLNDLAARNLPLVVFPLCNPIGYVRNWRYPDVEEYSESNPGHSVGDSDHLLLDKDGKPRTTGPSSAQAGALTRKVLELARDYPPVLCLDLHEDSLLEKGYLYSQGPRGAEDEAARSIIRKMTELTYPIMLSGKTRFGEAIVGGVVSGVNDGSIDELIASERVFVDGAVQQGPSGKSVIVVETSAMKMPLKERVRVHSTIIGMAEELLRLAFQSGAPR